MILVSVKKIPKAIQERAQWVNWKYVQRDGEPKPTKVPINAKTGGNASSTNRQTWSTLQTALNRLEEGGDVDGIGYVFADDHIGVDLDNAIDDGGNLKPWAADIVREFCSYTELSPSRKGVHIITAGALPEDWKGVNKPYEDGKIEIYSRRRFFTMTGDSINGDYSSLHDCSAIAKELYKRIGGLKPNGNGNGRHHHYQSSDLHETDLRLEAALRDPIFSRLWYGDTSGNKNDDSAADLALCNRIVFYFGADEDVVDRLFRQSKLYREKWERGDYRKWTIDKAIEGTTERYTEPRKTSKKGGATGRAKSRNEPRPDEEQSDETGLDTPDKSAFANLSNAVRIIEKDPNFCRVWFDEFLQRILTMILRANGARLMMSI